MTPQIAADILSVWSSGSHLKSFWERQVYNTLSYWAESERWPEHTTALLYCFLVENPPSQLWSDELVTKFNEFNQPQVK